MTSFFSGITTWCVTGLPLALLPLLLAGCGPSQSHAPTASAPALAAEVVAQVDGAVLTRTQLLQAWERQADRFTPREVLEEWIEFQALLAAAKAKGLHQRPDLQARFDRLIVQEYREETFSDADPPSITEQEIEAYYESHLGDYTSPGLVRGAVLFLKASPKAEPERHLALRQRADQCREEARHGDDATFRRLVQQHSDDQISRYSGGDTGWLTEDPTQSRWDPVVPKALWRLESPGMVAPLLETEHGFYIVKLAEKHPATLQSLDEVREGIVHRLAQARQQQRQRQFLDQARAHVSVQINQPLLDSLKPSRRHADLQPPQVPAQP